MEGGCGQVTVDLETRIYALCLQSPVHFKVHQINKFHKIMMDILKTPTNLLSFPKHETRRNQ